jgi:hypothetical protein
VDEEQVDPVGTKAVQRVINAFGHAPRVQTVPGWSSP